MFQALRTTTFLGLLAAGLPAFVYSQAAAPGALPPGQQKPGEGAQAPASSGEQTGATNGGHPLQLDAQHRPITAGGFVKNGPVIFEDVSEKAGLTHWTHKMGTPAKSYLIETKGSGVRCV